MAGTNIQKDPWLSEILGKVAFHLEVGEKLPESFQCECFIDVKIDSGNVVAINALQEMGFLLTDTHIQLKREPSPLLRSETGVRLAVSSDEVAVRAIAGSAFTNSRFHLDPRIDNSVANRIKSEWAGNFFKNTRGDWMVVVEDKGVVCGFLQLLKKSSTEIIIDLIAVQEDSQGKGFAAAMIAFAFNNCLTNPSIIVGTQVSNIRSLRLYESLGFRVSSAKYVFHLHL